MSASSASIALISPPRALFAAKIALGSRPVFLRARDRLADAAFCSRLRFSTRGISRRRSRFERLRAPASSAAESPPRALQPRARPRACDRARSRDRAWPPCYTARAGRDRDPDADDCRLRRIARDAIRFAKPSSRPPGSAPASCRRPKRSRRRCCRSSTSRSSSTASRRPPPPASTTSSSSPAAARTRSRITSTSSIELETFLEARGKNDLARDRPRHLEHWPTASSYVRQGEPLGLGHAVLVAQPLVGNEPFAVILADDVIDATPPALAQMIEVFEEVDGPVILVERVPKRPDLRLRRHRRRAGARRRLSHHGSGREAAGRAGAVGPRDHRPLHPDARHLRRARGDRRRIASAKSSSPTA